MSKKPPTTQERKLAKQVRELERRLDRAKRVGSWHTLWVWEGAPEWLRTASSFAATLGAEIVILPHAGERTTTPAKVVVALVKRESA